MGESPVFLPQLHCGMAIGSPTADELFAVQFYTRNGFMLT
jgi:hypothetical protein